jgi:hypothetical protein
MDSVTQQNAALVQEALKTSGRMSDQAIVMSTKIGYFSHSSILCANLSRDKELLPICHCKTHGNHQKPINHLKVLLPISQ